MGDSWEDEEFDVPVIAPPTVVKNGWDDEDEPEVVAAPTKPSAASIAAAEKKAREEENLLEAKLKAAALKDETPEQKRLRERKQAEESDAKLAGEMFGAGSGNVKSEGSSTVKGLGSIVLKTKQDHLTFGTTVSQKLALSSAFNIAAFYKTLAKTLDQPTVTSEVLDEVLAEINKIREKKLLSEKPAAKPTVAKKSKAAIAAETKKHNDKYGGSDYVDKYDAYGDMEDDFM